MSSYSRLNPKLKPCPCSNHNKGKAKRCPNSIVIGAILCSYCIDNCPQNQTKESDMKYE